MNPTPLLPAPTEVRLSHLAIDATGITVLATTRRSGAVCPCCGVLTRRIHSRYLRRLADLPWHGLQVCLALTTRRFFCDVPGCSRRIFTERLPGTAAPSARRTTRLATALDALGLALGGEAAARLAQVLGMGGSGATIRRLVIAHGAGVEHSVGPRVLGVDDWAWRRGRTYGTLLVDLERRAVIDLLPDRMPSTLAAWLRTHPGVEIISRDRGGAYAEGARAGAPDAIQVADRFHLVRNLGEAIDQAVTRHHAVVREVARAMDHGPSVAILAGRRRRISGLPNNRGGPSRAAQRSAERRARRVARYEQVIALHDARLTVAEIRRHTGLDRRTITTWLAAGRFPERQPRGVPPPRAVDPYRTIIQARLEAGLENASELARQLREVGYQGSAAAVRRYIAQLRRTLAPAADAASPPHTVRQRTGPRFTPRQTAWLLRRRDDALAPPERRYVAALIAQSPELAAVRRLAHSFQDLFTTHDASGLAAWLGQADQSELRSFARGVARDRDAVLAALCFRWSNGPVEGHVNRLKLIKRQGYGRTGFALLRQRVRRAG